MSRRCLIKKYRHKAESPIVFNVLVDKRDMLMICDLAEKALNTRWIPVSERLPEIGVRVLFYNNFIKNIHKGWYSGDEWVSEIGVFYNGDKLKRITHWMPLPKFPEVQE